MFSELLFRNGLTFLFLNPYMEMFKYCILDLQHNILYNRHRKRGSGSKRRR